MNRTDPDVTISECKRAVEVLVRNMGQEKLQSSLVRCRDLLVSVGEDHWGVRIDALLQKSASISRAEAEKLLSWFGGMGSFSDLVISEVNGHRVDFQAERRLNEDLEILRQTIFLEVSKVVREDG